MRWLKHVFDFYINSSIHVALAVCALALVTFLNFEVPVDEQVLAFIFLSSVTGYNFVKYAGVAKLHHRSLTKNLQVIQVFSLACFLLLLYVVSLQSSEVLWATAILGLLTFLYAVPFLPDRKNLRNLKTIKIFVIAFVWAGTCVLLPLVNYIENVSVEVVLAFVQYFLFVLAIIIPFEIRDLNYDSLELGTFPQRWGIQKTKKSGYLFLLVFLVLEVFISGLEVNNLVAAVGVTVLAGLMIYFSSENQNEYYASFWVESIPIFWVLLLFVLRNIN